MAKNHEVEQENLASENLPSPTTNTNIINSDSLFAYESQDFAQMPDSIPNSSLGPNICAEKEVAEALHVTVTARGNSKGGSKNMFQRVFSENDVICVLKAMLEFIEKTKSDPVANMDEFMKNLSNLDVTKDQLYTKMKRLKAKFKAITARERSGHCLKSRNKHKMEVYRLSQKIWGMDTWENDSKGKSSDGGRCMCSTSEQWIMDQEIEGVGRREKRKLEKKMREIQMAELQLFAMRCEYQAAKARAVCTARKANL